VADDLEALRAALADRYVLGTERFLGEIRVSAGLTHPNILFLAPA